MLILDKPGNQKYHYTMMSKIKEERLPVVLTDVQPYVYDNTQQNIVLPFVGSLLFRTSLKDKTEQAYVVVNVRRTNRGKNTDLISSITLYPVNNIIDEYVTYENIASSKLILNLTNHGNWWTHSKNRTHEYNWNDTPPVKSIEMNKVSISPTNELNLRYPDAQVLPTS